jgi:lipopolysaccharide exporter
LVIGTLSGRAVGSVLSYTMHSMRPRLSLKAIRPMLSFSTWNMLRAAGVYLNQNLHRILVGRRESTAVMGAYSLGGDIAALPSSEMLAPLNRVLFPLFVKLKHDLVQLKEAFLLALAVQVAVGIPASAGLIMVSSELVLTLLGDKWLPAVPFIQILAATGIVNAIGTSGGYLLLAVGRAKVAAYGAWFSVLAFISLAIFAIPNGGATAIAVLRLAVVAAALFLSMFLVQRELPTLRTLEILTSIWRPLLATVVMTTGLLIWPSVEGMPPMLELLVKITLGAGIYAACLLVLWWMVGCPNGAERYLLEKAKLATAMHRILRAK